MYSHGTDCPMAGNGVARGVEVTGTRIMLSVVVVFAFLCGIWWYIGQQLRELSEGMARVYPVGKRGRGGAQMISLVQSSGFTEFKSTSSIPDSVKQLLSENGKFRMVEPGAQFDSDCTHQPNGPPSRRFMFGAHKPDACILCFEEGGAELMRRVVICEPLDGQMRISWSGIMLPGGDAHDLNTLRTIWRDHKILGP